MPSTTLMMQEGAAGGHHWGKNVTWESGIVISSNYSFPSTVDGPTVIKYIKGLTINYGCTVTTTNRCKGLVLFVDGDCTINGTLTMTARGANAVGANLAIDYINAAFLTNPIDYNSYDYKIGATGGSGGSGYCDNYTGTYNGYTSTLSSGGGGAGIAYKAYGGSGSAGTSYSGGSGGGGCNSAGANGYNGAANGGAGGAGRNALNNNQGVGGGAGNPGGVGVYTGSATAYIRYGYSGSTGTGGLLSLIVRGNLTIGSTGIISSNGSAGGSAGGAPGGGSGAGNITILYTGTYSNSGSIQTNGGSGGLSYWGVYAGSGGVGSLKVAKILL